jgi:Methyltransferase domain
MARQSGIDHERLYTFRLRDVDQASRTAVWRPIAKSVHRMLGEPRRVLDPASGRGEFIASVPAAERWAVDRVAHAASLESKDIHQLIGNVMEVDLPQGHFDGIFVSNFLEHLPSPEAIGSFLARMMNVATDGGRIAVMGPNYRYSAKVYWDFADHIIALTHRTIEEHLYAAGFELIRTYPRFLPYSFTGSLPASAGLTAAYLRLRPAWWLFGKQFLVIAQRPARAS